MLWAQEEVWRSGSGKEFLTPELVIMIVRRGEELPGEARDGQKVDIGTEGLQGGAILAKLLTRLRGGEADGRIGEIACNETFQVSETWKVFTPPVATLLFRGGVDR